ncbi:hypothetical protein [Nocardioides sp. B-3]|nr:hypothetical protein [Nocardioides sp. B-3]
MNFHSHEWNFRGWRHLASYGAGWLRSAATVIWPLGRAAALRV